VLLALVGSNPTPSANPFFSFKKRKESLRPIPKKRKMLIKKERNWFPLVPRFSNPLNF